MEIGGGGEAGKGNSGLIIKQYCRKGKKININKELKTTKYYKYIISDNLIMWK